MRIGIDAKCLRKNKSGIGRYLRSLLHELEILDTKNEYILFTPSPIELDLKNPRFKIIVQNSKFPLPGILWQQFTLPILCKKEFVDILWGPEQTLPVCPMRAKRLLTVHDFVYKRYPETMQRSVLWISRIFGSLSIYIADKIACVSNFTKGELYHFYKSSKQKAVTVPCGIKIEKENTETVKRNDRLLFIGNCEPRKNLKGLLKALEILHEKGKDISLDIVGPNGWKNRDILKYIKESPVKKNIFTLGFVSEDKLKSLYAKNAALVFPSFYEGFGLPVLEALAAKAPVLTSKNSVMEELIGNCALYFMPEDPLSIAHAIEEFFDKRNTMQDNFTNVLQENRLNILNNFIWENSAKLLLHIFKEMECA